MIRHLTVRVCEDADKAHRRSLRAYAHTFCQEGPVVCVASEFFGLPAGFRDGVLAHEAGHLFAGPHAGEEDADRAFEAETGVRIRYKDGPHGRALQWLSPKDRKSLLGVFEFDFEGQVADAPGPDGDAVRFFVKDSSGRRELASLREAEAAAAADEDAEVWASEGRRRLGWRPLVRNPSDVGDLVWINDRGLRRLVRVMDMRDDEVLVKGPSGALLEWVPRSALVQDSHVGTNPAETLASTTRQRPRGALVPPDIQRRGSVDLHGRTRRNAVCPVCKATDAYVSPFSGRMNCRACEAAARAPAPLAVGAQVRLKRDVDRYPHFVAKKGSTGVVVRSGETLNVRMDKPLPGAEEWDNEIQWFDDFLQDVGEDLEVLSVSGVRRNARSPAGKLTLYHGTSTKSLKKIRKSALRSPYLTSDIEVAEYFAEDVSEDDDSRPVVLEVDVNEADLRVDYPALEEPLTIWRNNHARSDEGWFEMLDAGDVIAWPKDENDWKTSLEVTTCVLHHGDVPSSSVRVCEIMSRRNTWMATDKEPVENPPSSPDAWKTPPPCDTKATGKPLTKAIAKKLADSHVRVHLNLHNGCYVFTSRGKVTAYARFFHLTDVLPRVGVGGYRRCHDLKVRNVHAYLEGTFVDSGEPPAKRGKGWRQVTYNCKTNQRPCFYFVDNEECFEGAAEVRAWRVDNGDGTERCEVWVRGEPPERKKNPPECRCELPGGACACGAVDEECARVVACGTGPSP